MQKSFMDGYHADEGEIKYERFSWSYALTYHRKNVYSQLSVCHDITYVQALMTKYFTLMISVLYLQPESIILNIPHASNNFRIILSSTW